MILTALPGNEGRARAEAIGVADYLTKPFDPDRLMDAIRMHASA